MADGIQLTRIEGRGIPVDGNDIDTDRIVPARYLKEITFANMGQYAFFDERFDENGAARPHPFNDPKFSGATILIVNKNFGCGSSREHAPQAILRSGIRAIVAESFAEIFAGNCTVMGLPTVAVGEKDIADLADAVSRDPQTSIRIDLPEKKLSWGGNERPITVSEFVLKAFTEGTWDSTRLLLANLDKVRTTAAKLPYVGNFKLAP